MSNGAPNRGAAARTARRTTTRTRSVARALPAAPIAGALTVLPVGAALALRVATNAPVVVPRAIAEHGAAAETLAFVGPAVALVLLAVATDDAVARFGLVLAGVFGLLAAVEPAATVPAAGAVVAGGAIATGTQLDRPADDADLRRVAVATAAIGGVALTLASAFGLATATLRPAGAVAAMVALAGAPVFVRSGVVGWAAGGVAAVGLLAFAGSTPFVAGAVLLVAVGAVGVPAVVVAVGVAGGVAALIGGVRSRRTPAALGASCLLCAGVPATIPAALAIAVGVVLLARDDPAASFRDGEARRTTAHDGGAAT